MVLQLSVPIIFHKRRDFYEQDKIIMDSSKYRKDAQG